MLTSYPPQPPRKGQGYQPPPQRLSPDSPFMFGMFDAGPADLARPASLPQLPRLSEAELQEEALATLLRLFDASWFGQPSSDGPSAAPAYTSSRLSTASASVQQPQRSNRLSDAVPSWLRRPRLGAAAQAQATDGPPSIAYSRGPSSLGRTTENGQQTHPAGTAPSRDGPPSSTTSSAFQPSSSLPKAITRMLMPAGTQQTVSLQQAVDRSRTDETSSLGHGHELPAAQGGAAFGAAADQDDGAGGKVHGGKSWRCPNGFSALDLLGVERQSAAAGQQAGPAAGNGPAALPPPPAAIKDAGTAAAPSTAINGFNTPQPPSTQPAAALPPQPPPHLPPLPQLHHTVMQSATGQRVSAHHLPVGPPSFMSSFTTLKRSGSSRQHLSSLPKASHDMDENSAEEAESEDEEELRKVQANVASAGGQKGATGLLAASRPGDGRPDGQPGYYSAASTSGKRSKDAASAAASQHGQGGGQQREEEEAEEEEQTRAAAWRWKFTRRWRAEQTRAPSIDGKADGDETEEALQYLRATGGGTVALQVARTVSADIANSESTGTLDHMSLLASELLSDDASTPKAGGQRSLLSRAGSDLQAASKQVSTIARRAEALKEEQANIEKAAAQQWRVANSSTPPKGSGIKAEWVGSLLPSVEADDWGTFRAVIVKLKDRSSRQKLLLCGRNGCSEAVLVEELHRRMVQQAASAGLPQGATLEVLGSCVLDWQRSHQRTLRLHTPMAQPSSAALRPAELMRLAVVLLRQHLPANCKVAAEGQYYDD